MTGVPAAVLAGIPGWERAECRELAGGLSNRAWLVEGEQGRAVLKIDARRRGAPLNTRAQEAGVQAAAAAQGLAGRVLYASETAYLTEYLEGDVWTPAHLDDDANLERLAVALRRLHDLPLTGRAFDARQAALLYAGEIAGADPKLASDNLRIVETMPAPRSLACCHNDLVAGNIIATPEILFLDWEYACDNDPLFDLATITAHHDLSPERRAVLLDAYFDGDGARWRERLIRFERCYRALTWLWMAATHSGR